MRQTILFFAVALLILSKAFAGQEKIGLETSNSKQEFVVTNTTTTEIFIHNSISSIQLMDIETKGGNFVELFSKGYYKSSKIGAPQLPVINKLIEIPYGAEATISIIGYDEEIIDLNSNNFVNQLLPHQPSLSKSQDINDVDFIMDKDIYNLNDFYSLEDASIEYIGETRGVQIGRLSVSPFSYNPQTNELKIKNNLQIRITFKNADFQQSLAQKQRYYSPAFSSVFNSLLSVDQAPTRDAIVEYGPVKYIIVSDRMFESTLDPFVEWKTQKGFNVVEAYTDVIGSTTASIKTYLQDQYDNPSDGISPSYILFVGDIAQIPAWNSQNSGGSTDHISDLYYCEYTGDYIPEVYYGRFSATTIDQLTPQIEKTIEYERFEMSDPSFLNNVVLVAGVDGNWAPKHGNGQINYGTNEYFNTAHGFSNVHTYLYGSGSPITSDQSTASPAIQQNISDGAGFVNYTAHCNWDGWSDPSFDVNDIDNMTNDGKYPLMIGNCCLSNKFDTPNNEGACFGEEIMRMANGGVIGYIGGSNSTLWDEDFYWGVGVDQIGITVANANSHTHANTGLGAYDGSFHENGEAESDWYVTSGQMMFFGNIAVTEGGSSNILYYWEIYHLMGDPSLMPYFTVPSAITANHSNSQPVGISSLAVNTDAPGSYVAISKDGVLLDAQLADVDGNVNLTFSAIQSLGTADIVVTKQNRAPYIGSIQIIIGTLPPVADFTANNIVIWEGESINFTDLSSQAPDQWEWDFGDGNTSQAQYPTHTYTDAGTYTVSLIAINSNGQDDEVKLNYITVNEITQSPVPDFIADQTSILANESINFTDLSTNQANSWLWDFGDGNTSVEQNPSHIYSEAGLYTVSLTVGNIIGNNTETKTDYIEVLYGPYCDAGSNSTYYESITNVTFGSIDNDSGSSGYADYTAISTDATLDQTYVFSVSYNKTYSSDEVLVWIDWNGNHVFEDTEKYNVANGSGANSPYTYDITVPTDAVEGSTMMRVRLHDTGNGPNYTPCGDSDYGEVEDYTIDVFSVSQSIEKTLKEKITVYPNPSKGYINIKTELQDFSYSIVSVDARVLSQGISKSKEIKQVNLSNLSSGMYFLIIESSGEKYIQKIVVE